MIMMMAATPPLHHLNHAVGVVVAVLVVISCVAVRWWQTRRRDVPAGALDLCGGRCCCALEGWLDSVEPSMVAVAAAEDGHRRALVASSTSAVRTLESAMRACDQHDLRAAINLLDSPASAASSALALALVALNGARAHACVLGAHTARPLARTADDGA